MFITIETEYWQKIMTSMGSEETGEILIGDELYKHIKDASVFLDADVKRALVTLKRKVFLGDELQYAVSCYIDAIKFIDEHEGESYAKERLYEAQLRVEAILAEIN